MGTTKQHIEMLQRQLHLLKDAWPDGHLAFWDFVAAQGGIVSRVAYNFATGAARNPRLSTIQGIEQGIAAAAQALRERDVIYKGTENVDTM